MNKKALTGCLAAALLASLLASCGDSATEPSATEAETTGTAAVTEAVTEEAEPTFTSLLTPVDYNQATFRVYTANAINGWTNNTLINYAAEETGEVVNDALYARDRYIEETYNVILDYTVDDTGNTGTQYTFLNNALMAGDSSYHMILLDHAEICKKLSVNGMLYPLNYVDGINLDADYWMTDLNEKCKIGNSLYFANCAISPRYYSSVYIVMFNRDMARDLDLEDMYALVENGTWTYDKMFGMCKLALRDLDGNSVIDTNDQVGALYGSQEGYLLGAGLTMLENNNGQLKCMLDDEAVVNYLHKLSDSFQADGVYCENRAEFDYDAMVENGQVLFCNPVTANLSDYRDLTYDYGILPFPKQDEAQDGYYGFSQPWINATPMIPVTVVGDELSMAGTLTDVMAAYGYDYIRPAVFDNVICLKGTRDEQSARIIDLIFENVQLELASDLNLRTLTSVFFDYLRDKLGQQDIASLYAKKQDAIASAIQDIMDTYAENEANILG